MRPWRWRRTGAWLGCVAGGMIGCLAIGGPSPVEADAPTTAPVDQAASDNAGGAPTPVQYRRYHWNHGDDPVRMISKDQGFCFLTGVAGKLDAADAANVYIAADGYWYLGGSGKDVSADAMSAQFGRPVAATVLPAPDPEIVRWNKALDEFAQSADPKVVRLEQKERDGIGDDAHLWAELCTAWSAVAPSLTVTQQRAVEAHVKRLSDAADAKLPAAAADDRNALAAAKFVMVSLALNDLGQWKINKGDWSTNTDGKIQGHGDSNLAFTGVIPGDCNLEFHVNLVEGQRARFHFDGTGTPLYFGNEGNLHQLELFNAQTNRGVPIDYSNGQVLTLRFKFSGQTLEVYCNGQLMDRATRKLSPDSMTMSLSAGDGWSQGLADFWDFQVTAAK